MLVVIEKRIRNSGVVVMLDFRKIIVWRIRDRVTPSRESVVGKPESVSLKNPVTALTVSSLLRLKTSIANPNYVVWLGR